MGQVSGGLALAPMRHAAIDMHLYRLFPGLQHIGGARGAACRLDIENVSLTDKWASVTCPECLASAAFQRAYEVHQAAYPSDTESKPAGCRIPSMEVRVIWKTEAAVMGLTEDLLQPIVEFAMLPARYYVYVSEEATWLHLEAWGSRDEEDRDKYYRSLSVAELPARVFRYGEEPSRYLEFIEINRLDTSSGQRTISWTVKDRRGV